MLLMQEQAVVYHFDPEYQEVPFKFQLCFCFSWPTWHHAYHASKLTLEGSPSGFQCGAF